MFLFNLKFELAPKNEFWANSDPGCQHKTFVA